MRSRGADRFCERLCRPNCAWIQANNLFGSVLVSELSLTGSFRHPPLPMGEEWGEISSVAASGGQPRMLSGEVRWRQVRTRRSSRCRDSPLAVVRFPQGYGPASATRQVRTAWTPRRLESRRSLLLQFCALEKCIDLFARSQGEHERTDHGAHFAARSFDVLLQHFGADLAQKHDRAHAD